MIIIITPEVQMALYAYTAGVLNARREYAEHPTAVCRTYSWRNGAPVPCDDLTEADDIYCPKHRSRAKARVEHKRNSRAATRQKVQHAATQQRYRDRKAGK